MAALLSVLVKISMSVPVEACKGPRLRSGASGIVGEAGGIVSFALTCCLS